jgi:hypothetical protein
MSMDSALKLSDSVLKTGVQAPSRPTPPWLKCIWKNALPWNHPYAPT